MIERKENFLIFFPKYPVQLEKELIEMRLEKFEVDFTSEIRNCSCNRIGLKIVEEYSPCKNFSFLAAPSGKRTGELKTFSGQEGVVKRVSGITVPGIFQTDIFLQEGKEIATGSFRRSHFPISRDRGNVNTYRSLTYYTTFKH